MLSRWIIFLAAAAVAMARAAPSAAAYPVFGTKRYGRNAAANAAAAQVPRGMAAWGPPPVAVQSFQPAPPPPPPPPHYGYGVPAPPAFYSSEPMVGYPYSDSADYYYGEPTFASYPYFYGGKYAAAAAAPVYHHSLLPYYYSTTASRPSYYSYDDADPVDDIEEEMQAEEEREEREEALPVGQETWFEPPRRHSTAFQQQQDMADVNAIFLQNLILSQMYSDALSRGAHPALFAPPPPPPPPVAADPRFAYGYDEDPAEQEGWVYGDIRAQADPDYYRSDRDSVDEDVRALKSLVKKDEAANAGNTRGRFNDALPLEGGSWIRPDEDSRVDKKQPEYSEWVPQRDAAINFSDRKSPAMSLPASLASVFSRVAKNEKTWSQNSWNVEVETSTASPVTILPPPATLQPTFDRKKGMKEVALPRPATPVRHRPQPPPPPAPEDLASAAARSQKPRHTASVYETIKHLINMQERLSADERQGTEAGSRNVRSAQDESIISGDHMRPVKRFVSSEEALVEELSGLKKLSA